ncbi:MULTISPECIES: hypothetical protein [unclassified Citromicrobium]|uniref:hypothetical protein n=1 Tax=unclassified Citromicrobium TaxID=2630544 RepID=UPI0006C9289A|nr:MULTISPECIES: hypothetical protein [unclassified Citromicrobium]OAM08847.1 hypothetical protein A0U43_09555 [Citromicrobium sp. RCC1897]|tara:strand:+ start:6218 stop:6952 length:735 start_codon:yes stop_codon:yes gene_type:complete
MTDSRDHSAIEQVETRLRKPRSGQFTKGAIVLTIGYAILFAVYCFLGPTSPFSLEPNEFGDFLAGAFAPLAFLWLIVGYFQQGDELRYSADALYLQIDELKGSVEQQKELVKATQKLRETELEIANEARLVKERENLPRLELKGGGGSTVSGRPSEYEYSAILWNHGSDCTNTMVECNGVLLRNLGRVETGGRKDLKIRAPTDDVTEHSVVISYLDASRIERKEEWKAITGPASSLKFHRISGP